MGRRVPKTHGVENRRRSALDTLQQMLAWNWFTH